MFVEFALAAFLQVHPCDEVLPVNPSVTSPVVAGFCSTNSGLSDVRLFIGSDLVWIGAPTRLTGANAEGLYYYETPKMNVPKGTHVAYVDTTQGTEPPSEGYQFTVMSKGQANKVRIKGGN